MGGFVGNAFVRSDDQQAVRQAALAALRATGHAGQTPGAAHLAAQALSAPVLRDILAAAAEIPLAYISPSLDGWVGVFAAALEGGPDLPNDLAAGLSQALHTVTLSFLIWDGDFLAYSLVRDGQVLDEFHSQPGYMDLPLSRQRRRALRGNPSLLAAACGRPEAAGQLRTLLVREKGDPFALLDGIGAALGIANVALSHRYIGRPDEEIVGWDRFLTISRRDLPDA